MNGSFSGRAIYAALLVVATVLFAFVVASIGAESSSDSYQNGCGDYYGGGVCPDYSSLPGQDPERTSARWLAVLGTVGVGGAALLALWRPRLAQYVGVGLGAATTWWVLAIYDGDMAMRVAVIGVTSAVAAIVGCIAIGLAEPGNALILKRVAAFSLISGVALLQAAIMLVTLFSD